MTYDLPRRLAAEALCTGWLLAVVVGSGIMAERLSGGSVGLALLANAVATGAALPVIILVAAPLSGAHLNPVVSRVMALRGEIAARDAVLYALAQAVGAVLGVALAHAMFDHPALLEAGAKARTGLVHQAGTDQDLVGAFAQVDGDRADHAADRACQLVRAWTTWSTDTWCDVSLVSTVMSAWA